MNVVNYLRTKSQTSIDNFNSAFIETEKLIEKAKIEIQKPTRAPIIIQIDQQLSLYKVNFLKVTDYMKQRDDIKNNNLDITGKKNRTTFNYNC